MKNGLPLTLLSVAALAAAGAVRRARTGSRDQDPTYGFRASMEQAKGRDRRGSRARSPMYLWHGTSMAFLPSILRDGLRGPNWWGTKSMATYFADIAAEEAATPGGEHGGYAPDASTPVLICVPISRFDARKLAPDGNMIAEPMESLLEESTEDLYARWRASKGTWKDSLQIYEAVMYRGSMRITQDDVAVSDAGEGWE